MVNVTNPVTMCYVDTTGQPVPISASKPIPTSGTNTGVAAGNYETVAASQTAQVLGATGAAGDYLAGLLIVPATTAAGTVSIKDGNGSDFNVFVTGTLADLTPIWIPLGIVAVNATTPGWKVTTGANVSVVGVGKFT